MNFMQHTHIPRIDVRLLTVLQALVEERSITRAAERMFLSQPAMSRALDRLQEMFDDELLVRTKQGFEPTHRALSIYAELAYLLPRFNAMLRGTAFDPAVSTDVFRIAATDYAASVLFPQVLTQLGKLAPKMTIEIFSWQDSAFRQLESNALDLVIWANTAPAELRSQELFQDHFMCMVRKGHPIGNKPLTLERYLSFAHVMVTLGHQRQGLVDRAFEEMGLSRRVQLKTPYFTSAAWMIENSDLIVTLPGRLARRLVRISKTRLVRPQIDFLTFRYLQVWHPRMDGYPAHRWLRDVFEKVAPN